MPILSLDFFLKPPKCSHPAACGCLYWYAHTFRTFQRKRIKAQLHLLLRHLCPGQRRLHRLVILFSPPFAPITEIPWLSFRSPSVPHGSLNPQQGPQSRPPLPLLDGHPASGMGALSTLLSTASPERADGVCPLCKHPMASHLKEKAQVNITA